MSALILTTMGVCFVLLVFSLSSHRRANAAPEAEHSAGECRHCAALRHPATPTTTRTALRAFPRQRDGER